MTKCLVHPFTGKFVAELIPEKEVKICDPTLLEKLEMNGITISPDFKRDNNLKNWRIYPKDVTDIKNGKEIFAKAFAQFYFIHGLQQQGYRWVDKGESVISPEEIAKKILSIQSE